MMEPLIVRHRCPFGGTVSDLRRINHLSVMCNACQQVIYNYDNPHTEADMRLCDPMLCVECNWPLEPCRRAEK